MSSKLEPAAHGRATERRRRDAGAQGFGFQAARRRDLVLKKVAQEIEVKTLHDLEDGEFPIEVDCHWRTPNGR